MSTASMALPSDHPMMKAWSKFCETDEFKNALRWAVERHYDTGLPISDLNREQHAKGAMWLAFTAGMELNIQVADTNREALKGLMQYMGSTVDPETEQRNGTMIEGVHCDSERFMRAYDAAVEVLEPQ